MVSEQESSGFREWVVLELMGHRRLSGLLTEVQIAGHGFLRIDVPESETQEAYSQLYEPGAVYGITPTTEVIARELARRREESPIWRWELRALEPAPTQAPEWLGDEPEDEDEDLGYIGGGGI